MVYEELRAMAGGQEARGGWWCQCNGSGGEREWSRLRREWYMELTGLDVGGEGDGGIKKDPACLSG